jgi:hypothetical protein
MTANYRIITANGKIKYAGTDSPSWFILTHAKRFVNRSKGEKVYEYSPATGEKMWEVL